MYNLSSILRAASALFALRAGAAQPAIPGARFLGTHRTSPARRARRALMKQVGRRQALRQIKAERRAIKAAAGLV